MSSALSNEELRRYNRHIIMPEIGLAGQLKLKKAKVLVIGAGGLGCPILQYLAAAGVGTLGIVDFDKVDESNLQRQILFTAQDVGLPKAKVAAQRLKAMNPHIELEIYDTRLEVDNAENIISRFDVVADGSDNFPTRYLVNDVCAKLQKPLVFGSIFKFEGQVTVFHYTDTSGNIGPTYRCLFPEPPAPDEVPNCSQIGVLGVLPGIIGNLQANEVIKVITGIGKVLSGKLLLINTLDMQTNMLSFSRVLSTEDVKVETQYEDATCSAEKENESPKEISVEELHARLAGGDEVFILDVREPFEYEICNIGGLNIPMNSIQQHIEKIPTDTPVAVLCHHGMRSAMIAKFLRQEFGFNNLMNVEGGIHAWANAVDPEMPVY